MTNYKLKDDVPFITTYGELREWADKCKEVREWMERHLPSNIFEVEDIQLKFRHFYRVGLDNFVFLLAAIGEKDYSLVCVAGGHVGNHWGKSGSLEFLQYEHGPDIKEDLGPNWLEDQLAKKENVK